MPKYFICNGEIAGEVVTDNPANPDGLEIIEIEEPLPGDPFDYVVTDGVTPVFSIEKGRARVENHLRVLRKPLLEALDVQFMRALERGEDTAHIVAEKQRLRDITSEAGACNSIDELRALIDSVVAA